MSKSGENVILYDTFPMLLDLHYHNQTPSRDVTCNVLVCFPSVPVKKYVKLLSKDVD